MRRLPPARRPVQKNILGHVDRIVPSACVCRPAGWSWARAEFWTTSCDTNIGYDWLDREAKGQPCETVTKIWNLNKFHPNEKEYDQYSTDVASLGPCWREHGNPSERYLYLYLMTATSEGRWHGNGDRRVPLGPAKPYWKSTPLKKIVQGHV